jgi:gamma-F420-2:alpha-L-glutamate ligase
MDVPTSILEWVVATQDAVRERAPLPAESTALADMVFGGRSGLRSLTDRNTEFRRFASAVGLRMIAAGIGALVQASFPRLLVDRRSPTGIGLRSLFEGRMASELADLDDRAQERTLLVVLAVALWAAVLPWLAGAEAIVGGVLSLLALSFPVLFLLTAPAGRFGKARRRKGGGA